MGELVDRDLEHLRLLKIGYYVMAGMAGLFSLFSLIYIVLGGVFASGLIPADASSGDPRLVGVIFLAVGGAVLLLGLGMTFLIYLTGRSLAEHRRRIFCLVIAVLCCFQIPWGTAIGVFTFMVLSRPSVKAMFDAQPYPPAPPSYSPAPPMPGTPSGF
jgi:hypothetical protein